jgi:DNA-binding CsgD family transcriptional regulator
MRERDVTEDVDGRLRWILAAALGSIVVGGAIDLLMDRPATWLSFHVIFETLMIAAALVMATTLWLGWWRSAHSAISLQESLEAQRVERDAWKASAQAALEGLGRAIDAQFAGWHLTPTEREIALMLLKGYGHKEIAALTGRSERTVRQHAGVVYDKAGISGRAELAAFFLNDLMLPENRAYPGVSFSAVRPASPTTAVDRSPGSCSRTLRPPRHAGAETAPPPAQSTVPQPAAAIDRAARVSS